MKKSKRNYLLVVLVVLLLALAVGYAAFSANLTINGTATASGTWDVRFVDSTVDTATHGTATVAKTTAEGDTLNVDVTLSFPGDACTVTANIKNNGTIPAKLTGFTLKDDLGNTYSNTDIDVIVPTIATDGSEVIEAGETCPVTFAIKWKTTSTATNVTAKFKINFTYEQPSEVTVQEQHGSHI